MLSLSQSRPTALRAAPFAAPGARALRAAAAPIRSASRGGAGKRKSQVCMAGIRDPHSVLGVEPGASDKDIKRAYRKLALKYHPDATDEERAEQRFMAIHEAYTALIKPRTASSSSDPANGAPTGATPASWDFHDWYWSFSMKRRMAKKKAAEQAATAAANASSSAAGPASAADPTTASSAHAAAQPGFTFTDEHRKNVSSQMAEMRRRAVQRRKQRAATAASANGPQAAAAATDAQPMQQQPRTQPRVPQQERAPQQFDPVAAARPTTMRTPPAAAPAAGSTPAADSGAHSAPTLNVRPTVMMSSSPASTPAGAAAAASDADAAAGAASAGAHAAHTARRGYHGGPAEELNIASAVHTLSRAPRVLAAEWAARGARGTLARVVARLDDLVVAPDAIRALPRNRGRAVRVHNFTVRLSREIAAAVGEALDLKADPLAAHFGTMSSGGHANAHGHGGVHMHAPRAFAGVGGGAAGEGGMERAREYEVGAASMRSEMHAAMHTAVMGDVAAAAAAAAAAEQAAEAEAGGCANAAAAQCNTLDPCAPCDSAGEAENASGERSTHTFRTATDEVSGQLAGLKRRAKMRAMGNDW